MSQQLAVLRRANLVVPRREAGQVVYSISVPEVRDLLLAACAILSGCTVGIVALPLALGFGMAATSRSAAPLVR